MAEKPKTEVHTDNGLPPSVLLGRVSHYTLGDRRVEEIVNYVGMALGREDRR